LLSKDSLSHVPVLILGNKVDKPTAASEEQLRGVLGLYHTTGKTAKINATEMRPIELYMCSIVRRNGYGDGFRWMAQYL